jgi:protoporphyrinogen oxidase
LVSTTPLSDLYFYCTGESAPEANRLEFRNILLLFLRVTRKQLDPQMHVIYSFDRRQRWKRAVIHPLDAGGTGMTVEITLKMNENLDAKTALAEFVGDISKHREILAPEDIESSDSHVVDRGYPVLTKGYKARYDALAQRILTSRILTAGRQGRHAYISTDKCILDAQKTAKYILEAGCA